MKKGKITFDYEEFCEPPWEYSDCHGPVRKTQNSHNRYDSDKKPGERPLNGADTNEYQFYYDWQKAMKMAVKEWGCKTKANALAAVQSDFEYLHGWVNADWHYVGITVEYEGEIESCGMVETYKNYHITFANEMLAHLIALVDAQKAKESNERKYWNSRDVCTV